MARVHALILKHEAIRLKPYDDATGKELRPGDALQGKLTIGAGRNLSDNGVTKQEVSTMFDADVTRCERELRGALPWFAALDTVRQDAMIDMCYNLGLPRLLKFQNMLSHLERQEWDLAAKDALASRWGAQVPTRALEIASMLRTGHYQIDADSDQE